LEYLKKTFPSLRNIISIFEHGIDLSFYKNNISENTINDINTPLKFIYTSDFKKGLIPLLHMWPIIINKYPTAQLYIHCKLEENINSDEMEMIKTIINKYKTNIIIKENTNKKDLIESWSNSNIWFYPCTYNEIFCSDIMIAAITKTLIVTTKIKAFETYIEDRGILFDINNNGQLPYDLNWQNFAVNELFKIIENKEFVKDLVLKNFNWVNNMSWEMRTNHMIEKIQSNLVKNINIKEDKDILDLTHHFKLEKKFDKILNFGNSIDINSYFSLINEYPINEILTYGLEENKITNAQEIFKCRIDKINDNINLYNNIFNLIIYDNESFDTHELYLNLHICVGILKKNGILIINNNNESNINIIEKFFVKNQDKLNLVIQNNSKIIFEKI
jgi:hypothetical protein